jgi:quinol monooxygenase YgiN
VSQQHPVGNVALFAEFTAKPGQGDAVAELLLGLTELVRTEPGCVIFDPHRREANTDEFFVYEVYRDAAAFQAHITAPYGATFNATLTDLIVGDGSVLTWLTPLTQA